MAKSKRQFPPERQALTVLLAALELAHDAIEREHPLLAFPPEEQSPGLPASELLAELLVTQCVTLSELVQRYNDVIDHILDDDWPF